MEPLPLHTASDITFMNLALEQADRAAADGDVPVGCVVVDSHGCVIAQSKNQREVDRDPTAHAEIVALRQAAKHIGHWRLSNTTLYVTLEPCPMCAGAIVNARIARVVYGCEDPKAGAVRTLYAITNDPRLNHQAEIVGGVLAEACAQRLRDFFSRLRADGQK